MYSFIFLRLSGFLRKDKSSRRAELHYFAEFRFSVLLIRREIIQRSHADKAELMVCSTQGRSERPNIYCAAVTVYSCD